MRIAKKAIRLGYHRSMKPLLPLALLFAGLAFADQASDLAAIESVIGALNDPSTATSTLFEPESTAELSRLSDLDRFFPPTDQPMSEVTTPRIVSDFIRFVTSDVALVDAAKTQYGSVSLVRRVPLLLVLKREGTNWRIAAVRIVANFVTPR